MPLKFIKEGRKGWIDTLRCLAIILVVFGHCAGETLPHYFLLAGPVEIPLFLVISGYLLNTDKTFRQFLLSLSRTVIFPWLVLGWIRIPFLVPSRGWDYLMTGTLRLLSGEDLWFMPFFIIAETLHFCIRKYSARIWLSVLLCFTAFSAGLLLHRNGWLDFAMINRALTVQPFFLIGYFFRKYESHLIRIRWGYIILAAGVYLGLCFCAPLLFGPFEIEVHLNQYPVLPYSLLLILLGCLVLFTAACKADFRTAITSFIGQNTLVIYLWSGAAVALLAGTLARLGWNVPDNGWTGLIYTAWACGICGCCSILFNAMTNRIFSTNHRS